MQTIVKLPPQSQGQYRLHYWESGSNDSGAHSEHVRPCKFELVHVGDNMPCMAVPRFEMPLDRAPTGNNEFDRRCGLDGAAYFDVS